MEVEWKGKGWVDKWFQIMEQHPSSSFKFFLAVFLWLKPFWHNLHLPLSLFLCFSASQVKFCFIFLQIPGKANLTETITISLVAAWKRWEIIIFFPSMMGKNWKKVINRRSSKKRHRPVTIHLPCEIPILSKTTPKMIGFTNFKMDNFDLWYFWIRGVKKARASPPPPPPPSRKKTWT